MDLNIAVIKGDGIGPEIVDEAVLVLKKIAEMYSHKLSLEEAHAGGIAIDMFNDPLPKETIDVCKKSDCVLLGAIGGPKWDNLATGSRPEKAILGLRSELGLFTNLRPAQLHDSLIDACVLRPDIAKKGIDIMVVRELTGGIYFGERGRKQTDMGETAWDVEQYSEFEVRRIAKVAFETAMKRRKNLTSVDKSNVLESSRLWRSVVNEVSKEYPDVDLTHMYVDNASMQLIKDPSQFDVILTTNMFGDILSDEASQITGSIGMLPSASFGDTKFGMYEPIHGSAPDISGLNIANPIATILSVAMLFKYTYGLTAEAEAIENAVTTILNEGHRTADIYTPGVDVSDKPIGTKEMGKLILDKLG